MKQIALILSLLLASPAWAAEFGYHPGSAPATPWFGGDIGTALTVTQPGDATSTLKYTASAGDVIDSLYVYANSGDTNNETLAVAIYVITAGQPDTRLWLGKIGGITNAGGWFRCAVGQALSAGVTYCLAWGYYNEEFMTAYYDAGGSDDGEYKTTSPPPSPWGAAGTGSTNKTGLYAVYTASGGGGSTSLLIGGNVAIGGNVTIGGK